MAGTYERTLCGYSLDAEGSFTSIFNQPAHLGPVKAVASAGRYLVSGGSDEEIRFVISWLLSGEEYPKSCADSIDWDSVYSI